MKNRRLPYGYKMEKGIIQIHPAEAETVKRIFSHYLAGENLKEIAEALTKRKIEYLPGESTWNKNRIKRMIEDKRYLGDETYAAILDTETFQRANAEKNDRRSYVVPIVTSEDKRITHKVYCEECGGRLIHRTDTTQKQRETWYCESKECKYGISMTVEAMKAEITEIMNRLIISPSLAEAPCQKTDYEPSVEVLRMENEIERMLEALDFEKETVQDLILKCAAEKYKECSNIQPITDRLKADFAKAGPLSDFSARLFDRTVDAILLGRNQAVRLKLKNGTIIGKEKTTHGIASNAENCAGDSAQAGVLR